MKKVKLMLLSLSILAVIGGALAFTAKTGVKVCTTIAAQDSHCPELFCPDLASIRVTTEDAWLCSTPSVNGGCLDPNDPSGNTPLRCQGSPVRRIIE